MEFSFSLEFVVRIVQMFVCHSVGLYVVTTPRFSTKFTRLGWVIHGALSIIIALAMGWAGWVDYFDEIYMVMMGLSVAFYWVLSQDILVKKLFIFNLYASFYVLAWAISTLVSVHMFQRSSLAVALVSSFIYAVTFVTLGKRINQATVNTLALEGKIGWMLTALTVLFLNILNQRTVMLDTSMYLTSQDFQEMLQFLITILLIFVLLVFVVYDTNIKTQMQTERHCAQLYEKQLQMSEYAHKESQRYHHDLRHHTLVLKDLLQNDKTQEALTYLDAYQKDLLEQVPVHHCENGIANAVVSVYAQQAAQEKIPFTVNMDFRKESAIQSIDLTVLLSNLLENAMAGCKKSIVPWPFITLTSHYKGDKLVIVCENSCQRSGILFSDGVPINGQRSSFGTSSIAKICQKYGGDVQFSVKEDVFTCQLYLNFIS